MSCCEFSFSKDGGQGVEIGLLCEQIFAGGINPLLATGESHLSHNTRYKEAHLLLLGAYYRGLLLLPLQSLLRRYDYMGRITKW